MEDFSRYNGEGTKLRRLQLRQFEMLKCLDAICRKNNISYWIDFGTLLGAVRHQDFIPWDDDVDISVLEEDYGRLRDVLKKELPVLCFTEELYIVIWVTIIQQTRW